MHLQMNADESYADYQARRLHEIKAAGTSAGGQAIFDFIEAAALEAYDALMQAKPSESAEALIRYQTIVKIHDALTSGVEAQIAKLGKMRLDAIRSDAAQRERQSLQERALRAQGAPPKHR